MLYNPTLLFLCMPTQQKCTHACMHFQSLHMDFHSISYNSSNPGASPVFINSRMDREAVVHTPSGMQSREENWYIQKQVGISQTRCSGKEARHRTQEYEYVKLKSKQQQSILWWGRTGASMVAPTVDNKDALAQGWFLEGRSCQSLGPNLKHKHPSILWKFEKWLT